MTEDRYVCGSGEMRVFEKAMNGFSFGILDAHDLAYKDFDSF